MEASKFDEFARFATISFVTNASLFALGMVLIRVLIVKKRPKKDSSNDDTSIKQDKIPLFICTLVYSAAIGAYLLVPITIGSNAALRFHSDRWYLSWITEDIIMAFWRQTFWTSNISLFVLVPFGFFFHQAGAHWLGLGTCGDPNCAVCINRNRSSLRTTHRPGMLIVAKLAEAIVLLVLSSTLFGVLVTVLQYLSGIHLDTILPYLPFSFSLISSLGSFFYLLGTPYGLVRVLRACLSLYTPASSNPKAADILAALHFESRALEQKLASLRRDALREILRGDTLAESLLLRCGVSDVDALSTHPVSSLFRALQESWGKSASVQMLSGASLPSLHESLVTLLPSRQDQELCGSDALLFRPPPTRRRRRARSLFLFPIFPARQSLFRCPKPIKTLLFVCHFRRLTAAFRKAHQALTALLSSLTWENFREPLHKIYVMIYLDLVLGPQAFDIDVPSSDSSDSELEPSPGGSMATPQREDIPPDPRAMALQRVLDKYRPPPPISATQSIMSRARRSRTLFVSPQSPPLDSTIAAARRYSDDLGVGILSLSSSSMRSPPPPLPSFPFVPTEKSQPAAAAALSAPPTVLPSSSGTTKDPVSPKHSWRAVRNSFASFSKLFASASHAFRGDTALTPLEVSPLSELEEALLSPPVPREALPTAPSPPFVPSPQNREPTPSTTTQPTETSSFELFEDPWVQARDRKPPPCPIDRGAVISWINTAKIETRMFKRLCKESNDASSKQWFTGAPETWHIALTRGLQLFFGATLTREEETRRILRSLHHNTKRRSHMLHRRRRASNIFARIYFNLAFVSSFLLFLYLAFHLLMRIGLSAVAWKLSSIDGVLSLCAKKPDFNHHSFLGSDPFTNCVHYVPPPPLPPTSTPQPTSTAARRLPPRVPPPDDSSGPICDLNDQTSSCQTSKQKPSSVLRSARDLAKSFILSRLGKRKPTEGATKALESSSPVTTPFPSAATVPASVTNNHALEAALDSLEKLSAAANLTPSDAFRLFEATSEHEGGGGDEDSPRLLTKEPSLSPWEYVRKIETFIRDRLLIKPTDQKKQPNSNSSLSDQILFNTTQEEITLRLRLFGRGIFPLQACANMTKSPEEPRDQCLMTMEPWWMRFGRKHVCRQLEKTSYSSPWLDVCLVASFAVFSVVGLYASPFLRWLCPRPHATTIQMLLINASLITIMSASLPVLAFATGLTSYDLLQHYEHTGFMRSGLISQSYCAIFFFSTLAALLKQIPPGTTRWL